jgi:hypothetical protein
MALSGLRTWLLPEEAILVVFGRAVFDQNDYSLSTLESLDGGVALIGAVDVKGDGYDPRRVDGGVCIGSALDDEARAGGEGPLVVRVAAGRMKKCHIPIYTLAFCDHMVYNVATEGRNIDNQMSSGEISR